MLFLAFAAVVGKDIFSYWKTILFCSAIILILNLSFSSRLKSLLSNIFKYPLFIIIGFFTNLLFVYNTEIFSEILKPTFLFIPIGWILFLLVCPPKLKNNLDNFKKVSHPIKKIFLIIGYTLVFIYSYISIIIGALFFAAFDALYFINVIGNILK